MNPPQIVSHNTNDLVWDRFTPGLRQTILVDTNRLSVPNSQSNS